MKRFNCRKRAIQACLEIGGMDKPMARRAVHEITKALREAKRARQSELRSKNRLITTYSTLYGRKKTANGNAR